VRVADPGRTEAACTELSTLGAGQAAEVLGPAELSLPVRGDDVSAAAVRVLDGIGVGIAGLELLTPTLDDVFLTLTGRAYS
jgi:hypothetical protein